MCQFVGSLWRGGYFESVSFYVFFIFWVQITARRSIVDEPKSNEKGDVAFFCRACFQILGKLDFPLCTAHLRPQLLLAWQSLFPSLRPVFLEKALESSSWYQDDHLEFLGFTDFE